MTEIQKIKVYVKYPAEAPKGTQVYNGERGGHYYETEETSRTISNPQTIKNLTDDAKKVFEVVQTFPENGFLLNDGSIIKVHKHTDISFLGNKRDANGYPTGFIRDDLKAPIDFIKNANAIRIHTFRSNIAFVELNVNSQPTETQFNQLKNANFKEIHYDLSDNKGINVYHAQVKSVDDLKSGFEKIKQHFAGTVQKAKVYVKSPQEVPTGKKIERGKHGGLYYQSGREKLQEKPKMSFEDLENLNEPIENDEFQEKEPEKESSEQLQIFNEISPALEKDLKEDFENVHYVPLTKNITEIIKSANIDKNIKIKWLPITNDNSFAYCEAAIPNNMYVFSTPDQEIIKFIEDSKIPLKAIGYDVSKLTIKNKQIATIVHEEGHLKSFKAIGYNGKIISIPTSLEKLRLYQKLVNPDMDWLNPGNFYQLLEVIAEDYRQIKGGDQAAFPNKYMYKQDILAPEDKKDRLRELAGILKIPYEG